MADDDGTRWYWCLRHDRVEPRKGCPATFRMGPYASQDEARAYAETAQARNEEWEEEDERWYGR